MRVLVVGIISIIAWALAGCGGGGGGDDANSSTALSTKTSDYNHLANGLEITRNSSSGTFSTVYKDRTFKAQGTIFSLSINTVTRQADITVASVISPDVLATRCVTIDQMSVLFLSTAKLGDPVWIYGKIRGASNNPKAIELSGGFECLVSNN